MKILMLCWELPPYNSGGLGEAAIGIINSLVKYNVEVAVVLPIEDAIINKELYDFQVYGIENLYNTSAYSSEIYNEQVYIEMAKVINSFNSDEFDIIHLHDWLNVPVIKHLDSTWDNIDKVYHIHSLEQDRVGNSNAINEQIKYIELQGLALSDKIITVSNYTKNMLCNYTDKDIEVVHNAINKNHYVPIERIYEDNYLIGFIGRFSHQKGCFELLNVFANLRKLVPNIKLVMIGDGDLNYELLNKSISLDIINDVIFTGFVRDDNRDKLLSMLDVLVMPSVSEPFGLVALEAISAKTNVIVSTTTGVSEVLPNVIKIDYHDINGYTNSIYKLLTDKVFANKYLNSNYSELRNINWDIQAEKIINIYNIAN